MRPYVLKLSFGGVRNPRNAHNGEPDIEPHQSTTNDYDTLHDFIRPALAEFFGSLLFALLRNSFTGALLGFTVVNPQLSTSFYEGATIFLLMCIFGKISGGHFNPTITIAVLLCGHCRIVIGICIVFMQFFGSFIGAMLARSLIAEAAYMDTFHGSILDESSAQLVNRIQAFFLDTLLSFLLCLAYLFTAIDDEGNNGILCTTTVSVARSIVSFIGYRPLGQCANIARSVATSAAASIFLLNTEPWRVLYIYFFASITGALLAAFTYWISRQRPLECMISGECKRTTRA